MASSSDRLNRLLREASRRQVMAAMAGGVAGGTLLSWRTALAATALNASPATRMLLAQAEPDAVEGDTLEWLAAANPGAAAVVNDVIARSKYAFAAAAAGVDTGADPVGAASRRFLATRTPARRAAFLSAGRSLLQAPPAVRQQQFGRYAALAPTQAVTLNRQALAQRLGGPAVRRGSVSAVSLAQTFGQVQVAQEPDPALFLIPLGDPDAAAKKAKQQQDAQDLAKGKTYKHLEFYVRRVECFEGTGDPGGHDEISLAGYGIGATGNLAEVPQFHVSDNFIPASEGGHVNHQTTDISARDYGDINGRHFCWFGVNQKEPWPHDYQAGVAMGEIDWGGFGGFVNDLWSAVGAAVVDALADAAVDGLAALAGTAIPIPGLGTLIGLTIGALINFIIQAVKDDVVGTIHTQLTLRHMTDSYYATVYPTAAHPHWHGHLASKDGITYTRDFKDTGHYKVKMGWRLFTEAGYDARQLEIESTLLKANGA